MLHYFNSLTKMFLGLLFWTLFTSKIAKGQNDLPGPSSNIQTITTGSLVIPMDNALQSVPGYFNLKAYGFINQLLQNNIPVKWAIKAGKSKDGVDFSADAQRIRPSLQFPNWFDFRCGPFIVDSSYATAAKLLAAAFGGNVTIYQLTANVSVDIRYTLNFKPKIAICSNGGDQSIHINALTEANMYNAAWVTVIPASQIVPYCGYTIVSELHWAAVGDTVHTRAVYKYIKNGGNFFAQCRSVQTYEDDDTLQTTTGISIQTASTMSYLNPDLPIMQFDGTLINPGGSLQYWNKNAGGAYRATTYTGIQTSGSPTYQFLDGAKVLSNSSPGGNVFYLGGHDYNNTTSNGEINGRRIYLNAVFIPPGTTAMCSILPVSLLYFHAKPEGNIVNLRWATGSEQNNDHFLLERSQDGHEYSIVKSVTGSGTSSSVSFYSAVDMLPLPGTSYYRLTQVDYDGTEKILDPVSVHFKTADDSFSIYPNPATEGVSIHAREGAGNSYTVELTDLFSKELISQKFNFQNASNEFYLKFPDNIPEGIYSLKVSDGFDEAVFKLVIRSKNAN